MSQYTPKRLSPNTTYATFLRHVDDKTMTHILTNLFKILGILVVATTSAGPFIPITIDRLSTESDLIVYGSVIGKTVQKDDQGRIYTKVQLDINEVWKGKVSSKPFTIVHSGGVLGNRWSSAEGEVSYKLGEEVVVFLVLNSRGEGVTMGMQQGKFQVLEGIPAHTRYVRSLFHGGKPPNKGENKGYRFPTQLPLTVDSLKRKVSR